MFGLTKWNTAATAERNAFDQIRARVTRQKQFTPDMRKLSEKDQHLLFVCDEMKQGFHENKQIKDQLVRVEHCFTEAPAFSLFVKDLGKISEAIPLCIPADKDSYPKSRIKGELHLVTTEKLMELDIFKRNTVEFERRRAVIDIFYTPVKHAPKHQINGNQYLERVHAWMYVGMNSFWEPLLDGGRTFRHCRKFGDKGVVHPRSNFTGDYTYYSFTNMELNE